VCARVWLWCFGKCFCWSTALFILYFYIFSLAPVVSFDCRMQTGRTFGNDVVPHRYGVSALRARVVDAVMAVTKRNANATMLLLFLYKLVEVRGAEGATAALGWGMGLCCIGSLCGRSRRGRCVACVGCGCVCAFIFYFFIFYPCVCVFYCVLPRGGASVLYVAPWAVGGGRCVQVLKNYFKELEDESIRDNFVITYEVCMYVCVCVCVCVCVRVCL